MSQYFAYITPMTDIFNLMITIKNGSIDHQTVFLRQVKLLKYHFSHFLKDYTDRLLIIFTNMTYNSTVYFHLINVPPSTPIFFNYWNIKQYKSIFEMLITRPINYSESEANRESMSKPSNAMNGSVA